MKLNKILEYAIYTGLVALLLLPLVVSDSLYFPFITGKNLLFRLIITLIFFLWVVLAVRKADARPRFSWLLVVAGAFVVWMFIADALGVNFFRSLWSNFERMEGWFTLLYLFALFITAGAVLRTEVAWSRLFHTSIGVSIVLCIYSFFQLGGKIAIDQGGVRVDATLGNSAYFAIYLAIHIFLILFYLMRHARTLFLKATPFFRSWLSYLYLAGVVLETIILFYTGTRGTVLGVAAGLFIALILTAWREREFPRLRKGARWAILVVVLLGFLFLGIRNTPVVQNNGALSRIAHVSLDDALHNPRFMIWGMAIDGVKERPVSGWGQGNFGYIFNKYYDPGMYAQEQWFDRAHNVVLDWLTAGGVVGLALYLSLFVLALVVLWKTKEASVSERAVLTGLLIAYFVHNIFVFDNIVSYLFFFLILAYIHRRSSRAVEYPVLDKPALQWGLPIAAGVLSLASLVFIIVPTYSQASELLQAITLIRQGDSILSQSQSATGTQVNTQQGQALQEQGLQVLRSALDKGVGGTQEVLEQMLFLPSSFTHASDETKREFAQFTESSTLAYLEHDPQNARLQVFLAAYYDATGQEEKAIPAFARAVELSPNKQTILFAQAGALLNAGKTDEALAVLKHAYELDPSFDDARIVYAAALIRAGHETDASPILKERYGTDLVYDPKIIAAYYERKEYRSIFNILQNRIDHVPNDMQARVSLAAAYNDAGMKKEAIAEIQSAIEFDPNFKSQGEAFIKQIQTGQ